jgi:16S rRNA (adenine1518-N6/adenine1519-N6)-dimethyltransferase
VEHRPRKRFGQNFLHDPGTIRRILTAIDPGPDQHLVEIGPGRGAITAGLLAAAGRLDVIELDRDLVAPLAARLGAGDRLRVYNADALTFDLCALAGDGASTARPAQRLRLVGNLPYNISTPLLFRFLDQAHCIEDLHLMLQKEVVDRMCAAPGSKTYGRLSVMVQTWCSAERLFVIGPGAFTPPPKVDSALVRLRPHRPLPHPIADPALHARLVAAAFAQRRKTLRNALRGVLAEIGRDETLIAAAGLDPAARAETVSVGGFAGLVNKAASAACKARKIP